MSIDKKELVRRVQERLSKGSGIVEDIIDATVEEIYESLRSTNKVRVWSGWRRNSNFSEKTQGV